MEGSGKFSVNATDWQKVLMGLVLALAGAGATYLIDASTAIDFGVWTPVVVAVMSAVANLIRKWVTDHTEVA